MSLYHLELSRNFLISETTLSLIPFGVIVEKMVPSGRITEVRGLGALAEPVRLDEVRYHKENEYPQPPPTLVYTTVFPSSLA